MREDATPLELSDRALLMLAGAGMIGEAMESLHAEAVESGDAASPDEAFEMFADQENMAYFSMVRGMALGDDDAIDLMRLFCVLTEQAWNGPRETGDE